MCSSREWGFCSFQYSHFVHMPPSAHIHFLCFLLPASSQYTNQFAFYWLFTGVPSSARIASHKSCISSRTSKIILYILVCVSLLMATTAFLLAFLKCMFNISIASSSDELIHASCHYQTMLRNNSFTGNKNSFKNTATMK